MKIKKEIIYVVILIYILTIFQSFNLYTKQKKEINKLENKITEQKKEIEELNTTVANQVKYVVESLGIGG